MGMNAWECVIGLEIHVETDTETKMFCACRNECGATPNSLCCPVCAGLPGAMPTVNGQAVALAIRAGLALGCAIHRESRFDRKHYFYPDLPKGYQITQYFEPICGEGRIRYAVDGVEKELGITRIHMEEDAGKLIHGEGETLLDLNRCGVPLIEIVTEPELRSPREAAEAFREIRRLLVFAGVTRGRMNEGHLRCDVNLSLHKPGQPFGTRCEIKNLNSFGNVEKACAAEIARQSNLLLDGRCIPMMTLRFDGEKTLPMRRKETPGDYRYLPEPDLPRLCLAEGYVDGIRESMPMLPMQRMKGWVERYGITAKEADVLCRNATLAECFEGMAQLLPAEMVSTLVHLLLGEVFALWKGYDEEDFCLPFDGGRLAELAELQYSGEINATTAKKLARKLTEEGDGFLEVGETFRAYARHEGLCLITDEAVLMGCARDAVTASSALAEQYKAGKTKVFEAIFGKAMGLSRGRADAEKLRRALKKVLQE